MRILFSIAALAIPIMGQLMSCGRSSHRGGKIVGGEKAQVGEFPWQIALLRRDTQICGGSIISSNFVMTAAHCLKNNPSIYKVAYGSLRKYQGPTEVPVESVHIHPGWQPTRALTNDIAILKLAKPISFDTKKAAPICIPPKGYEPTGFLKVSGWGRTKEGGTTSQELMFTMVPVISDSQCKTRYGAVFNNASMFCAMYPAGGKDSCQGDSGGPAVINHGGVHYLSGVVSWGEGCARFNAPGVYTRVSEFTSWIEKIIQENGSPQDLEQIRKTLTAEELERINTGKVQEPYLTTTTLSGLIQDQLPSNPAPSADDNMPSSIQKPIEDATSQLGEAISSISGSSWIQAIWEDFDLE